MTMPLKASVLASALTMVLAGCAVNSATTGLNEARSIAETALQKDIVSIKTPEDAAASELRVGKLLKAPLSANTAVQIALLNNRGLQAAYAEIGFSQAQLIEASVPANPVLAIGRMDRGFELEIERRIIANILSLATLPVRYAIAETRFQQAQLKAAEATLRLATETRKAYIRAVSASQLVDFLQQTLTSAEAASELAKKLGETGGLTKLDQARDHVYYAEIGAQLAQAKLNERVERERLTRLMGLWGDANNFKLPRRLPDLPRMPKALPTIEAQAVQQRVDLQIARLELEAISKQTDMTRATRFVSMLDVAGMSKYTRDKGENTRTSSSERGLELEVQFPIFDLGTARVMQAEASYMQAFHLLSEKAVNVRSEAREAYQLYRGSYDIARLYQRDVVPLRKVISDETLLNYNGMIMDTFQLLADARARITSYSAAIEAKRNFWIAEADLQTAVWGGAGMSAGSGKLASVAETKADH